MNNEIEAVLKFINKCSKQESKASKSEFVYVYEATYSNLYIKITRGNAGCVSAWCFIDEEGNVWKAASFNQPDKNFPRGNIKDLLNKKFVMDNIYSF